MKLFTMTLSIGALALGAMSAFRASADLEVSASVSIHATADFHSPLASHGTWIEVGSYGRCWRPASVAVEWRPYCDGHWVWTDCGWYWASDEPWAWACYHYGSWAYESGYGWIWVPGVEWAPAWVSWRFGGGYCGWAPLGPRGIVVAPASFVFVESHRFHEPIRPRTVIVNNTTIINRTTVINNMRSETRTLAEGGTRKVMVNEGPGAAAIERETKKKVTKVSINEASRQTPVPATMARKSGNQRSKEDVELKGKGNDPTSTQPTKPGAGSERRFNPGETPQNPGKGRDKKSDAAGEPREPEKKSDAIPDRPPGREKKSDEPEQPKSPSGRRDNADEAPDVPPPPAPPEKKNPPSHDAVAPGQTHPPQPNPPPSQRQRPPRGKEKGRGQGTDRS